MKKNILTLVFAIFLSVTAFAQNGMTKFEQLPATAQEFIKTYFSDYTIQYIFCDKEFADVDYKIRFEDGTEIEFNAKGEWTDVSSKQKCIPTGFILKEITDYVTTYHKDMCITPNYVQGRDNPDLRDRWKPAHWEGAVSESSKSVYEALLQIHTLDTVGVLADITVALADMKVSILQINSQKAGADRVIINLKVSCKNVEHYSSIVSRLRGLKNILDVTRGFS